MEMLFPLLIVFGSVLIQACTGFGFGIIAIPLLMLTFDAHTAIFLSGALSLASCLIALPSVWRHAERRLMLRVFGGSLIGLPLGALLYFAIPVLWLKLLVSISILVATALLARKTVFRLGEGRRVGVISGTLSTSVGMPGPPLVMLLTSKGVNKDTFRGTSVLYNAMLYPISLLLQWMSDRVIIHSLAHFYWYIPAILLGQWIGSAIQKQITPVLFRGVTLLLLLVTGVNALIPSLVTLYQLAR
ncbi:sulfite exporter TauE/SafE family protein [Paenibacillus koleovorans]|uniref:sulfite exporter TauE/SafE family protein n=1 Tax=Paenibacillus koleovorans TaxID=121608 RepID=UPI0013E39782|nr:sulfite exporter TauE/SafE family protein [Paenibacillus koleovorans]